MPSHHFPGCKRNYIVFLSSREWILSLLCAFLCFHGDPVLAKTQSEQHWSLNTLSTGCMTTLKKQETDRNLWPWHVNSFNRWWQTEAFKLSDKIMTFRHKHELQLSQNMIPDSAKLTSLYFCPIWCLFLLQIAAAWKTVWCLHAAVKLQVLLKSRFCIKHHYIRPHFVCLQVPSAILEVRSTSAKTAANRKWLPEWSARPLVSLLFKSQTCSSSSKFPK